MSVGKNFLYNAAYQAFILVLPFVTVPWVSRVLGPTGVGMASYAGSVAGYFGMVGALGMGTYGVRVVSAARRDVAERSRAFWSLWLCQLMTVGVAWVAYLFYLAFLAQGSTEMRMVSAAYAVSLASAALDVTWFFFGLEEFKAVTLRNLAVRLASVVATLAVVRGPGDVLPYVVVSVAGSVASQLALWPFLRGRVMRCRVGWREMVAHLRPNLGLFVPVLAFGLYTTVGKVMLGAVGEYEQTAFLGYADSLARMPQAIVGALTTVMLPHMTALLASGRREEGLDALSRALMAMMVASIGLAAGIAAVAPSLVPLLLGPGYEPVVGATLVLVVVLPIVSFSNVLGRQYLIPLYRDRGYTASLVAGAAVELPLAAVLIPLGGVMGAASCIVAAEMSVLAVQVVLCRHELPLGRWSASFVPYAAAGLAMLAVVRGLGAALGAGVGTLALQVVVGAVLYVALAAAIALRTRDDTARRVLLGVVRSLAGARRRG